MPVDPVTGEALPYPPEEGAVPPEGPVDMEAPAMPETSPAATAIDDALAGGAQSGAEILDALETQGFTVAGGSAGEAPMEDMAAMPEEGLGEEGLEEAPPEMEEGPDALRRAAVQFGISKDEEKKAKAREEYA